MAKTPYTETEALLAVMNDGQRLGELLDGMLRNELHDLKDLAITLQHAVAKRLRTVPAKPSPEEEA